MALNQLEKILNTNLPHWLYGAKVEEWLIKKEMVNIRCDFSQSLTEAHIDQNGIAIINPHERVSYAEAHLDWGSEERQDNQESRSATVADSW